MRRTPAIVNSARILALVLAPFCVLGCPKKKPRPAQNPSPSPSASPLALSGTLGGPSKVTLYKKGKKWLEVTLGAGQLLPRSDRSLLATVTGQKAVAYENGKPALELSGDLVADTKNQTVTVKNGATVKTLSAKSPASLFSDTMRWNRLSKTLAGENNVRFESAGVTLSGDSFAADDALTHIHLMKPIKPPLSRAAVLATAGIAASSAFSQSPAGPKLGEFTPYSVHADVDFRSRKGGGYDLTMTGDPGSPVSIRSAFLEITARKIAGQSSGKPSRLSSATATGQVYVKRVDEEQKRTVVLRCDRAEYHPGDAPKTGRVDLFGKTVWKTFDRATPLEVTTFEGDDGAILDFDTEGYRVRMKGSGVIPVDEKPKKGKK